ncbi:Neuropeptides capa receptor [Eumeta japonica]|uniref:Neuropeptides capa receptor n=1 Tax=Eumeta variegata TaxID=151549 RepID=A0A4C1YUJ9_EUMVA|nr:Neuropeptides capa receptor [Eumeta japonica]
MSQGSPLRFRPLGRDRISDGGDNGAIKGEWGDERGRERLELSLSGRNATANVATPRLYSARVWYLTVGPAAVVIAFFVCWAPFHFQRLFYIYGAGWPHYHLINEYLFNVAGAFYYVSATVNPILYNVMSHRYRIAFKETLCCRRTGREKSRYYREQSSVRETTINHTCDGMHLVRVRSKDKRTKLGSKSYRNSSMYVTETTSLCTERQKREFKPKNRSKMHIRDAENAVRYDDNENFSKLHQDNDKKDILKMGTDVNATDCRNSDDININISIHLHSKK